MLVITFETLTNSAGGPWFGGVGAEKHRSQKQSAFLSSHSALDWRRAKGREETQPKTTFTHYPQGKMSHFDCCKYNKQNT